MRAAAILFPLLCCFVAKVLPYNLMKKFSDSTGELHNGQDEKESKIDSIMDEMFMEKSLILENCEVQKHVLSRLRDLVMMSISQVKLCMAQSEQDELRGMSTSINRGPKESQAMRC